MDLAHPLPLIDSFECLRHILLLCHCGDDAGQPLVAGPVDFRQMLPQGSVQYKAGIKYVPPIYSNNDSIDGSFPCDNCACSLRSAPVRSFPHSCFFKSSQMSRSQDVIFEGETLLYKLHHGWRWNCSRPAIRRHGKASRTAMLFWCFSC